MERHTSTRIPIQAVCPICSRSTAQAEPKFIPFCGERCKLVDLGRWFDGDYRIAGESVSPGATRPDDIDYEH